MILLILRWHTVRLVNELNSRFFFFSQNQMFPLFIAKFFYKLNTIEQSGNLISNARQFVSHGCSLCHLSKKFFSDMNLDIRRRFLLEIGNYFPSCPVFIPEGRSLLFGLHRSIFEDAKILRFSSSSNSLEIIHELVLWFSPSSLSKLSSVNRYWR